MGMAVAMTGGAAVHSKLVGQLGPYSSHGHSSSNMSNMYTCPTYTMSSIYTCPT